MADLKRAGSQYGSQNADATSPSFEGTAARTRPCSVEDIILKRYSKKLMKDAKEGNSSTKIKSELVKPDIENIAPQSKDGAGEMHAIGSVPGSISRVKKNSGDELPSIKDTSSRREEKHNMKDTGSRKRSEKDDSRVTSKIKLHKDEDNSKAFGDSFKEGGKEERSEKRSHYKSKGYDERKDSDYHREDKKEPMKGKKERIKDKGLDKSKREERGSQQKYEDQRDDKRKIDKDRVRRRESKRKHEDDQDEKIKMENDKGDKKKNDAKFHLTDKVEKRQDSDYSERKERWKESSHPSWHKETKSKRRKRSLSPDHKKAKERGRSPSSSPRSHKRHSSYYGKDHDQDHSSHHISVEKSERDRMDSEKIENDNNGASAEQGSHYRRYGGGTSGLGGYSPRRRRSETAVKTPSPPVHLPERKPGWDLTPGGMDSNMVAAMVAAYQASTQQMAASSITSTLATVSLSTSNLQNPNVSASQFVPSVSQQVDSVMDAVELTQSTRPSRRIVVNNLPSSVSEGEFMEFLNSALLSKSANHLPGTKPCISCVVNGDKNQAYVEFLTPEDATATLLLDGITLNGNNLKIKRPKDYAEPAIFIGGISRLLSSDKVKEIVTAFGQLKAFRLEVDTNETFAFFEYVDQSVTLKACAGLNGMRLGDGIITVVQATPDASVEVECLPNYGIPDHAKVLMQKPTRIVKLKNVLTKEELQQLSEEEIEEISEDVRLECTRFGAVKSVNIVRCNSQGDHIKNIQTEKNGNLQSCLPDTSNTENQSESLKDQEINAVEGIKKNGKELKDVDLGVKYTCLEENESGEQQMANKMDVTDTTNNNAIDISSVPAQEMQEHSKAAEDHEMSSPAEVPENTVTPQSVHALELGESLGPEIMVQVGRDETESCLDPDNVHHQMTVAAETDESESSRDSEFLEVGSVLVEFSREEASCLAAHTLNGRLYGTRKVIASYIPNIVYQQRFPRGSLR
ncbi:uncharacterized protein LOC131067664 isoform X2 [Cryptomeria japonica]|uniref:uncharacterized protein LOC131067664 isoform X2 n=1 Tax=Cryptomeria japonica TaxID=3369 RepID=UPI0027D9DE6C|nr:uncharacterized protein LOC131067664 isoform X2 [Cryptomeria japonica]